jgi:hypothetical protein
LQEYERLWDQAYRSGVVVMRAMTAGKTTVAAGLSIPSTV